MLPDLLAPLLAEAHVLDAPGAATVTVRFADDATAEACLVQTSAAPPPPLAAGDAVLVLRSAEAVYLLGRLGPVVAPDARTVQIVMPAGVDTVRVTGRRVSVAAEEELELTCGPASLRMDRRGKVVVLGTDVTSRARRRHKIKGATVAIN